MTESASAPAWQAQLTGYLRDQARPVHKYGHQERLVVLIREIAERSPGLRYDSDVTFAAAFLHDLGVFVGHRPEDPALLQRWDHVAYACEQTPALLQGFGFAPHKVQQVLQCIREHQPHDEPSSMEATLLRDADILEQLGAVAVFRTASKLGSDTRFHTMTSAVRSLEQALETLPPKLRFAASKDLAAPRVEALKVFLAALHAETGQHLG